MKSMFFLLILIPALFSVCSAGSPYTVCSLGCQYTTIQSALDAGTSGDTVTVGPGLFSENIVINKPVILVGTGNQTIITTFNNIPVVRVISGDVAISMFSFKSGSPPVQIEDADRVSVDQCTFSGVQNGIEVMRSREVVLDQCSFVRTNGSAVQFDTVMDSRVQNSNFESGFAAIFIRNSYNVTVVGNDFKKFRGAVLLMDSNTNQVTNNNFLESGFAVTLVESSGNEINENVVNTTDEFLDLISSFQNHASLTRIGKSIYASEKLSGNNRYDLETTRVTGQSFSFSIQRPPLNGGYVYLGDGITAVLSSEFPQHEGAVHVEAVIPKNITQGFDPASIGFYRYDKGNINLISAAIPENEGMTMNATVQGVDAVTILPLGKLKAAPSPSTPFGDILIPVAVLILGIILVIIIIYWRKSRM